MFVFLKNIWHLQSPNDMCIYVHSYRNQLSRVMSLIKHVFKTSFILSFLFFSCSPKIHENFESNHYVKEYRIHSFNDSLMLSFNSPSDIFYSTDKFKFLTQKRKSSINLSGEVLFYGI